MKNNLNNTTTLLSAQLFADCSVLNLVHQLLHKKVKLFG